MSAVVSPAARAREAERYSHSPDRSVAAAPKPPHLVPLCVDLDGTLLRSDMFYESLLVLVRKNPFYALLAVFWILRGRANLKYQVASRVQINAALLPYDTRLIALLRDSPQRPRVLCTAADRSLASSIAAHLGVFDDVIASDASINLKGLAKADALLQRYGPRKFDYVGNSSVDLHVWRHARQAWVVNGSRRLARSASRVTTVAKHLPPAAARSAWLKALRPHQWLKNFLVFVPLLAAHRWGDAQAVLNSVSAFLAFGLCASGVYVINDLFDLAADRAHPTKRNRPMASGDLSIVTGMLLAPALVTAGMLVAITSGHAFAVTLLLYFAITLLYSLSLKATAILDVLVLAGLYTMRVIGGAVAAHIPVSFWLLAFSIFLFLSLAVLKRCVELRLLGELGRRRAVGRGYLVDDLPLLRSLGCVSGYLSVLVLALYINSPESIELYRRPYVLWLICPLLLYWISRAWLVGHRGHMNDDPLIYAATDKASQVIAASILMVGMIAI